MVYLNLAFPDGLDSSTSTPRHIDLNVLSIDMSTYEYALEKGSCRALKAWSLLHPIEFHLVPLFGGYHRPDVPAAENLPEQLEKSQRKPLGTDTREKTLE